MRRKPFLPVPQQGRARVPGDSLVSALLRDYAALSAEQQAAFHKILSTVPSASGHSDVCACTGCETRYVREQRLAIASTVARDLDPEQ